MVSVTFVAPLPPEIIGGEKLAVAPAGRPEAENVICGSVFPLVGLTEKVYSAVSPGRTVCVGVLVFDVFTFRVNGREACGPAAAFTVTDTAAEMLVRRLEPPIYSAVTL
jgi:hypothetical protein